MNLLSLLACAGLLLASAEDHLTAPLPDSKRAAKKDAAEDSPLSPALFLPETDPAPVQGAASRTGAAPKQGTAPRTGAAPAKPPAQAKPAPKQAAAPARRKAHTPPELVVSSTPIVVAFPPEGQRIDARAQFIFGTVSHPLRSFHINGSTVTVHRKGGFLAYLPVSPGRFSFVCELDLPGGATTYTRTIQVRTAPAPTTSGVPELVPESVLPDEDAELRAGDWLTVRARGTAGLAAHFTIGSSRDEHPMPEVSSGLYEGAYRVGPSDSFSSAEIVVALKRERRVVTRAAAHGRLSTPQTPPGVAWVRGGTTYIRSAPESGFILFPAPGTRLLTTARVEGWAKVELTPSLSGWIEEKSLERLPAGTPPPAAVVGTIRAAAAPGSTVISLDLSQQVPYEVEESPDLDRVTLRLYYSAGHTNWVIYDDQDDFLRQVRWEQRGSDVVEVTADLRPGRRLWGYDVSYKERSLRLELRHPPAIAPKPRSALSGRVIIVDPGHSPSSPGAIGPHRTLEMDVNYALAKELEALLSAEGAQPVVTRSSPADEVTLGERMRLAWSRRGDAFVSVHNNALADGENPFDRPHGYSVFFYHPHSLALARATHQAYGRDALLPSEGLRYGNLMVARATQMPSILTESAYLMYPDQEDLLLTPAKRREFARAMLEGLRRFFEAERERQAAAGWPPPPPAPRAKAKTAPGPKQGAAPRTGAARAQPKKNTKRP